MNIDLVLLVLLALAGVSILGLALAWTIKLTREIPSNFDALEFDNIQSNAKSCIWWK